MVFVGTNLDGNESLWVTNGTAAGTHQMAAIAGAAQEVNQSGTYGGEAQFAAVNGLVLFPGMDASNEVGLWVTNGAASGTYELTGIAGAAASGLDPYDLTVFNGEALFGGSDSSGNTGLWFSNGTAAGTYELTGIAGASTTNFDPVNFTDFNGKVLFGGTDASGQYALWATNGTAAGTQEIGTTGINSPMDRSGAAILNGAVLFDGGNYLWVTDGTAAGTQELAVAGGYTYGLSPEDLTAFNGEVLFNGQEFEQ